MAILTGIVKSARLQFTRITTGSTNRRIFRAALIVGSLTFIVKLGSMVKESFIAAYYGTGESYDALIIALLIPMATINIIGDSLNSALMPTYIEVRDREGREKAQRLYSTVLMWNMVLLLVFTLVIATTVSLWLPLIASGFSPQKLAVAKSLFIWSLPIIVIRGFSTTWGAILNAGERFGVVALAPAVYPITIILSLVVLFGSSGIHALLLGTVLGYALEAAIVGGALARRGYPLLPHWTGMTDAARKVRSQYAACIADASIIAGIGLIDQTMASMLGPRSNSALSYGYKLVTVIMSLGALALSTAILPQFSRLTAANDWTLLRRSLKTYTRLVMGITIPLTAVLIMISSFLVKLLYQRGAFAEGDTQLVATVQSFYLLQLPFIVTLVLVTRAIIALKATQILMVTSAGVLLLKVFLNYVFMHKFGVAGIALSTTGCSLFVFIVLMVILYYYLLPKAELSEKVTVIR